MVRSLGLSVALALVPALMLGAAPVSAQPRARPVRRPLHTRSAHVQPAMGEVRAALRRLAPEVQRCSDQEAPLPGRGTHRRLRLRVWLLPTGRWTLEVPELEGRSDQTVPYQQRRSMVRLFGCLNLAVAQRVGRFVRPYRSRRRHKVERAFRVTVAGPPPTAAALARRVRSRRAQLIACVPGGGLRGANTELVVRATLGMDGEITLQGLAVPTTVPFDAVVRCVSSELAQIEGPHVTSERAFETVVRFHYDDAPAASDAAVPGAPSEL